MSISATSVTRVRQSPKGRILTALLAISVALNLCVVAGVVWSRLHTPHAPPTLTERFHRLADTLDLTPQQRVAFDQYVADMASRGERMRHQLEPMMDAAWTELSKPDVDPAHVVQMLDDAGNQRRNFMHEAVNATVALLQTLTPEQRAKFIAEEREFHTAQRNRRAAESR